LFTDDIPKSHLINVGVLIDREWDIKGSMLKIANWDGDNVIEEGVVVADDLVILWDAKAMDGAHQNEEANLFLASEASCEKNSLRSLAFVVLHLMPITSVDTISLLHL